MGAFSHEPVMVREVLEGLGVRPGGFWLDGTVGGGGHAAAVLEATGPDGWLWGMDRDEEALKAAGERLAGYVGRFELKRDNFAEMGAWLKPSSCDGVLLDLGVSSPQLDRAERGFSFQQDGPLDMRMDQRQSVTAAQVVNEWADTELAAMFREYGDEPMAWRIARAIVTERQARPFQTTRQLADLIERLCPRMGRRTHPATRVFQSLRMEVNQETHSLKSGLAAACTALKPGGRLAVLTFHSQEDRVVKWFGREMAMDYTFDGDVDDPMLRRPRKPVMKLVHRKAVQPSDEEVESNPRARSAQLRVMEKMG